MQGVITFALLTVISSTINTLRSMFLARKQFKANYIATFIDAILFATIMKKISSGDGVIFALAYAIGRTLGAFFGNKLEARMALGIIQVDISLNHFEKMIQIADNLRDLGYSVETSSVFGYGGNKRYKINITISRSELDVLKEVLNKHGYTEPTFIIKDVTNISGKITVQSE